MGGKSAPDPPDYLGLAQLQADASSDITRAQTYANRPNQYTPWGASTWNVSSIIDPASGQRVPTWTQNLTLSPQQQQALTSQFNLQAQRSGLAGGLYDRMADEYRDPVDWNQFEELRDVPMAVDPSNRYYTEAEEAIYGQFEQRAEPRMAQQLAATEAALRNQGLVPGDEAYDFQIEQLRQQQEDARLMAQREATRGAGAEAARMMGMDTQRFQQQMAGAGYAAQKRQQQIGEELQRRGFTLNEINAILYGQQVAQPGMPSFTAATKGETPQYLAAGQMGYRADLDQFTADQLMAGGLMSGLFGLGGAYLGRPT